MLLDPDDFEPVWQHICACATEDQRGQGFIDSFAEKGGNWVRAVQPEKIQVESLHPKGSGFRWLSKSQFRREWAQLVRKGYSSNEVPQVLWDMLTRYFDDVERQPHDRNRLFWTGFHSS